ncbi:hypothetical protein OY671_008090, partial [Metschnikowia pulcherrima]
MGSMADTAPEDLAGVTMPVSVLCGDKDNDNGSADRSAAASPDARRATIPGTHMSSVTVPEMGAEIVSFLTTPASRGAGNVPRESPSMKSSSSVLASAVAGLSVTGLAAPACAQDAAATPATVKTWSSQAEKDYFDQSIRTNRTEWVYQTNITYDTAELTSAGNAASTKLQVDQAKQAAILAKVPGLAPDVARKSSVIRTQITTPAPTTPGAAEEFAASQARVQGIYGKGHGTSNGEPVNGSDIEEAMGTTRDPAKPKEMWVSWHATVGTPMKADYVRMVAIANAGASQLGFADAGASWRTNYDIDPAAFA